MLKPHMSGDGEIFFPLYACSAFSLTVLRLQCSGLEDFGSFSFFFKPFEDW